MAKDKVVKRPFYHEYAWAYDVMVDQQIEKRVAFIKEIASLYHTSSSAHVLDAGCGAGQLASALASEGYYIKGIDLSPELISEARKKSKENKNPHFEVMDILKLNETESFDLIICRGVLNDILNVNDRQTIVQLIARALKPNGLFIADVRSWKETQKRKILFPIHEKTIKTEDGSLRFVSNTELNESEKTLEISECHTYTNHANEQSEFPYFFKMKCWTLEEITEYCNLYKLSIQNTFGDYSTSSRIGDTDRIVFVAQKQ